MLGAVIYLYVSYGRIIDARLHGERDRATPRIFARPLTLQTGQNLSQAELIARLNDVGYAQRSRVERAGRLRDRSQHRGAVVARRRSGRQSRHGVVSRAAGAEEEERQAAAAAAAAHHQDPGRRRRPVEHVTLDAPLLTALMTRIAREAPPRRARHHSAAHAGSGARDRGPPLLLPPRRRSDPHGRRDVHERVRQSAVPGRRQHHHAAARAEFLPHRADGRSSSRRASDRDGRKILEQFMSLILETKATKDEILELYLNDVYLGHRGSFALHGVAEAAQDLSSPRTSATSRCRKRR